MTTFPEPTLLSLNGIELEVFEAGREHAGNPVVLCHGWPEHAFSWRHQIPVLVEAGFHVLVPNQRGYGRSSCPERVEAYGIEELTGDLVALLDHYGYASAPFVGHDWGSMVVWGMAMLHPERVSRLVSLALPYQERGEQPWLTMMEQLLGPDYYFVKFNREPGLAEAVLDRNPREFLSNLFRREAPPLFDITRLGPEGEPILSATELDVFAEGFQRNGFTPSTHWYRNLDRNWHTLAAVDPVVRQPALMVYGLRDAIPQAPNLSEFVPNVRVEALDCGHWIQQELPDEANQLLCAFLVPK